MAALSYLVSQPEITTTIVMHKDTDLKPIKAITGRMSDPHTAFLPGEVLRTEHGAALLNMMVPDQHGVLYQFVDVNALSVLGIFGLGIDADLLLAMMAPQLDKTAGVRKAGDEFVFITAIEHGAGEQRFELLARALEQDRADKFEKNVVPSNTLRMQLLKAFGHGGFPIPDVIDSFDSKFTFLTQKRINAAQDFADWKSGARELRRNYLDHASAPHSVEGFARYLFENYGVEKTNPAAQILEVLRLHPELRNGPKIGSFERITISIPGPITLEKLQAAAAQSEKLLHTLKKSPGNSQLRTQLSKIQALAPDAATRIVDQDELALAAESTQLIEQLKSQLLVEHQHSERKKLEHAIFLQQFSDPALRGVLRAARAKAEPLGRLTELDSVNAVVIDLEGFAPLNNSLGYSRADEIMRALVEVIEPADQEFLVRVSGGKLVLLTGRAPELRAERLETILADVLAEQIAQLSEVARVSVALEFVERQALSKLAQVFETSIFKAIDHAFGGNDAVLQLARSMFKVNYPSADEPRVVLGCKHALDTAQTTFGNLGTL